MDPAEKIIGKPIIAGGVVFATSFVPTTNDPCQSGGRGFLYAFDYMCRPFGKSFNPITEGSTYAIQVFPTSSRNDAISGARMSLGLGVPSQPVLDSTGKYIIVQTSNAEIFRVNVNLEEKMNQIKGWTEKD
jgi:type IV pilus assembly protein PilY1